MKVPTILCLFLMMWTVSRTNGLSCSAQYECLNVTSDYNYVQCVDGQCTCLTSNGFNGTATDSDKCRCDYQVAWGNGQPFCKICNPPRTIQYASDGFPYCVNDAECENLEIASDNNAFRMDIVKTLYSRLVYPTPIAIITGQLSVADLFDPNVRGRISPLGTFEDFQLVDEYFFGLGSSARIQWVNVTKIAATGDYVTVWVNLFFNNTFRGTPSYNLTQTGFFTFDSSNKIISMDLDILNLGWALDRDSATNPVTRSFVINSVCNTLMGASGTCKNASYDPDGHYTDFSDCISFMNSITYGTWAHANSNTVICRVLHSLLTPIRPQVHCPHTGKTGGMKCIDTPYADFYAVTY